MKFNKSPAKRALASLSRILQQPVIAAIEDSTALGQLPKLDLDYLPWTGSSLRPSGVRTLLNELVIHGRSRVIECGIGISTLYSTHLLSRQGEGGYLLGIDHSAEWIAIVDGYLREIGVDSKTYSLLHAPLDSSGWYDRDALREALTNAGGDFDLLFVDGPISIRPGDGEVRAKALPFLHEYLDDNHCVMLDDAWRPNEERIATEWARDYDMTCQIHPSVSGVAILRPRDSASFNIL